MDAVCAPEDAEILLNIENVNISVPCTSSVAFPNGAPLSFLGGHTGGLLGGPQGFVDHSDPNGVQAASGVKAVNMEEYMSNACRVDVDEDSNLSTVSTDLSSEDVKSLEDSECGMPLPSDLPRTYTIFDWDDTLFPTTWIQMNGLMAAAATQEQLQHLERLTSLVKATLQMSLKTKGEVVIVTNGDEGWVQLSMRHFMPEIEPLLTHNKIAIISARSRQEHKGVPCPFEWKRLTFAQLLEEFYEPDDEKNIVCLGDSMHEHHAISTVTQDMDYCIGPKCIKFCVRPDVETLCQQHERLANCFETIVHDRTGGRQHFDV